MWDAPKIVFCSRNGFARTFVIFLNISMCGWPTAHLGHRTNSLLEPSSPLPAGCPLSPLVHVNACASRWLIGSVTAVFQPGFFPLHDLESTYSRSNGGCYKTGFAGTPSNFHGRFIFYFLPLL